MTTNHSPRGERLSIGLLGLYAMLTLNLNAQTPHGVLDVDRSIVAQGTRPNLDWKITYPPHISNYVSFSTNGSSSMIAKRDATLRVRLVGASFQTVRSNNGHGNNLDGVDSSNPANGNGGPNGAYDASEGFDDEKKDANYTYHCLELLWSKNNSAWDRLYYGTQTSVVPTNVLIDNTVKANDKIDFGARAYRNGWLPLYNTASSSPNVMVLKAGDPVPKLTGFQSRYILKFLKPYLSADGRTVKIGHSELLVFFELGQSDTSALGFNLQDLVILASFE